MASWGGDASGFWRGSTRGEHAPQEAQRTLAWALRKLPGAKHVEVGQCQVGLVAILEDIAQAAVQFAVGRMLVDLPLQKPVCLTQGAEVPAGCHNPGFLEDQRRLRQFPSFLSLAPRLRILDEGTETHHLRSERQMYGWRQFVGLDAVAPFTLDDLPGHYLPGLPGIQINLVQRIMVGPATCLGQLHAQAKVCR
jgi:hypothetical protein